MLVSIQSHQEASKKMTGNHRKQGNQVSAEYGQELGGQSPWMLGEPQLRASFPVVTCTGGRVGMVL